MNKEISAARSEQTKSTQDSRGVLQDIREGFIGRIGTPVALYAAIHYAIRAPEGPTLERHGTGTETPIIDVVTNEGVQALFSDHTVDVAVDNDMVTLMVDGANYSDGIVIEAQPAQELTVQVDQQFNWGLRDYSHVAETEPGALDADMEASIQEGVDQALGMLAPYLNTGNHELISAIQVHGVAYRSPEGSAAENQVLSERTADYAEEYTKTRLTELGFSDAPVQIEGIGELGSEDDMVHALEQSGYSFHGHGAQSKRQEVIQLIRIIHDGKPVPETVNDAYTKTMRRGVTLDVSVATKPIDLVVPVGTPPEKIRTKEWAREEEPPHNPDVVRPPYTEQPLEKPVTVIEVEEEPEVDIFDAPVDDLGSGFTSTGEGFTPIDSTPPTGTPPAGDPPPVGPEPPISPLPPVSPVNPQPPVRPQPPIDPPPPPVDPPPPPPPPVDPIRFIDQLKQRDPLPKLPANRNVQKIQVSIGVSSGLGSSTVRGYHYSSGIYKRDAKAHHTGKRNRGR